MRWSKVPVSGSIVRISISPISDDRLLSSILPSTMTAGTFAAGISDVMPVFRPKLPMSETTNEPKLSADKPSALISEPHVDGDPFQETEHRSSQRPGNAIQQVLVLYGPGFGASAIRSGARTYFFGDGRYRSGMRVFNDIAANTFVAADGDRHHDVHALPTDNTAAPDKTIHLGNVKSDGAREHGRSEMGHRYFYTCCTLLFKEAFGASHVDIKRAVDAGIGGRRVDSGRRDTPRRIESIHLAVTSH